MRLIGLAALAGTPTNCQYYSPSSEKSRWSRSHIWVTKIIFPKVEPGWGFGSIASEKNRQHAGYLGWGKNRGAKLPPLAAGFANYLLMESLFIDPPLSIFTLIIWIEFLSA